MNLEGWQRAHQVGPGLGAESDVGILYAPPEVNLQYQNSGIEGFIREFNKNKGPGVRLRLVTEAEAHPNSLRLKSITYRVSAVAREGRPKALFEVEINIQNVRNNPRVTLENPEILGDWKDFLAPGTSVAPPASAAAGEGAPSSEAAAGAGSKAPSAAYVEPKSPASKPGAGAAEVGPHTSTAEINPATPKAGEISSPPSANTPASEPAAEIPKGATKAVATEEAVEGATKAISGATVEAGADAAVASGATKAAATEGAVQGATKAAEGAISEGIAGGATAGAALEGVANAVVIAAALIAPWALGKLF